MTDDEAFQILRSLPPEWGVPETDVQKFEARFGVCLPWPLRDLMLSTGRERHMRWLFPEPDEGIVPFAALADVQETAQEILREDPPAWHPPFPFVALSQHHGYVFSFVRADAVDADPEIMSYQEFRGFTSCGWTVGQEISSAVRRSMNGR